MPYSAIAQRNDCTTFVQFTIGRKGSTGQHHSCYPDGEGRKRQPVTPFCGCSVARSIGYCSTIRETNRSSRRMSLLNPHTAQDCQPGISLRELLTTARHTLRSGKSLYVTIHVTSSPGSSKSLLLVTALYLLHTYQNTSLHKIGRGMTSVVGHWLSRRRTVT